jgi:hypothetical protein
MKKIFWGLVIIMMTPLLCLSQNSNNKEYFDVFLNKNGGDLIEVFVMHQPTLADCRAIFKDDYYKDVFKNINQVFVNLSEQTEIQNNRFKNKTACRLTEFNSNNLSDCPQSVKNIGTYLNPGIKCYKIEFLESETSELGVSYYFFTIINNRWVYFPIN